MSDRDAGFKSQLEYGDLRQIYDGNELFTWRERERYLKFMREIYPTLNTSGDF